jgi:hypothetical protein
VLHSCRCTIVFLSEKVFRCAKVLTKPSRKFSGFFWNLFSFSWDYSIYYKALKSFSWASNTLFGLLMSQGVFGNFPEFFEIFWAFFALCKHILDFLGFVFALKMISEKKENLSFYFGPSPRARPIRPKPRPPPHPIKGRSPRRAPPAVTP